VVDATVIRAGFGHLDLPYLQAWFGRSVCHQAALASDNIVLQPLPHQCPGSLVSPCGNPVPEAPVSASLLQDA
jgi:hypothetical protein